MANEPVSAICKFCGRMSIDPKYYEKNGNAMTKFIICSSCKQERRKTNNARHSSR